MNAVVAVAQDGVHTPRKLPELLCEHALPLQVVNCLAALAKVGAVLGTRLAPLQF
jgi:hypothetical protein